MQTFFEVFPVTEHYVHTVKFKNVQCQLTCSHRINLSHGCKKKYGNSLTYNNIGRSNTMQSVQALPTLYYLTVISTNAYKVKLQILICITITKSYFAAVQKVYEMKKNSNTIFFINENLTQCSILAVNKIVLFHESGFIKYKTISAVFVFIRNMNHS